MGVCDRIAISSPFSDVLHLNVHLSSFRGVIVSTRGSWRRLSGATVTGPDNQLVIIDQKGLPVGTRIKGIVPWEIRRSLGRLGARLLLIADGVA